MQSNELEIMKTLIDVLTELGSDKIVLRSLGGLDGNSIASASNIFLIKIEEESAHIHAPCFGRSPAG